jgi:hypothetical protein
MPKNVEHSNEHGIEKVRHYQVSISTNQQTIQRMTRLIMLNCIAFGPSQNKITRNWLIKILNKLKKKKKKREEKEARLNQPYALSYM